jgi:large subunit ribosomal protein L5
MKEIYNKKIRDYFKENFGYKNILSIPHITKIVVNTGIGKELSVNPKFLETAISEIAEITGQKPKITKSTKAISGFKLRKGMATGLVVTMRGKKMYDFLNRLINITLPRIRDFRGIKSSSLDKSGNLNIGISEHIVFPEIKADQVVKPFGLQINIVANSDNRKEAKKLFEQLGFIFEKKSK